MPAPPRRTLWVPLSVHFWQEAEDAGLSQNAAILYLRICCRVKELGSDGVISRSTIRQLGVNGYWHSLKLLVRSGWISDKGDDQFYVSAWLNWNESLDDIYARRKADRTRKRVRNSISPQTFRIPD